MLSEPVLLCGERLIPGGGVVGAGRVGLSASDPEAVLSEPVVLSWSALGPRGGVVVAGRVEYER